MTFDFDFDTFETVLYRECKNIFPKITAALADEGIYSMALYYSGDDWLYLFPTVSTNKGLSEVVLKYKKEERYQDISLDDLSVWLKWSPCDSPHHGDYADNTLKDTDKMLLDAQGMDALLEDGNYIEFSSRITDICMRVLDQLNAEDIFKPLDRSSFVLNLLAGDQSEEERLSRAKILNPKDAFEQYKIDIAKELEVYKILY